LVAPKAKFASGELFNVTIPLKSYTDPTYLPLGVSADELLGVTKAPANNGPIKNRRLYRQLQNIEKLPKRDQQALLRTIDAFLAKAS